MKLDTTLPTDSVVGVAQPRLVLPSSFVRMFKPQFAGLVERGEKLQTVRPMPKRMPKVGDRISLRCWEGKPYRSKQKILREAIITAVSQIRISDDDVKIEYPPPRECVFPSQHKFAVMDGFSNWFEMREWFRATHGLPFTGILISWQNAIALAPPPQRLASKKDVPGG